jgi:hypothetical protein
MSRESKIQKHPLGIKIVAALMILFGVAEVVTSFTGNFLNVISTVATNTSTLVGAAAGSLYVLGGLFTLTMRKWGAALGIACIGGEISGRIYLVTSGLFPMSATNADSIVAGTVIALAFAVYLGLQWRNFR